MKHLEKLIGELQSKLDLLKDHSKEELESITVLMNTKEIQDILSLYLEYVEDDKDLDEDELKLLQIILEICNTIYNYSGKSTGLSDSEYDSLIEYYRDKTGRDLITQPLITDNDVVHHLYKSLRGTLDKIYKLTDEDVLKNKSQKSLEDWVRTTEKRYLDNTGMRINLMECDVLGMPKFDGLSCVFECDRNGELLRALTRGDTSRNEAQDITHIFKGKFKGPFDDAHYPYGLKTEIMMLDQDLERFNTEFHENYKNTRSIVSSILNSDERDMKADYLQIIPLRYSYMTKDGESEQYLAPGAYDFPMIQCKLKDVDKLHDFAFDHKTVQPGLRCDGMVIYIVDKNIQKVLGRENEKQKYEVAFKFTEEKAYSKITDVIFTTGLFGRMNPIAVIKPVKMKGNTVEKASLGSYARFKSLELAKGDKVKVLYDIIPYIDFDSSDEHCERSGKEPISEPLTCPDCGSLLVTSDSGDILYCDNKSCPCRERGKILNYTKKMNISNISYATIETLYNEGYLKSIEDLYRMNENKNSIIQIPGIGVKKINNIIDEIEKHKEVIPSVLLGSIGIEGISTKTFKNILQYINMRELIDISSDNNTNFFTVIPGIKDKTAKKIVDGINENRELISHLVNVLYLQQEPRDVKGSFTVLFTKIRSEEKEKYIEECGGTVADTFNKNIDLVVIPEQGVTSSKVEKARKYGIPVIPINELEEYIQKQFL